MVELCSQDVRARIDELKNLRNSVGQAQYDVRKEHVMRRMQKLVPGNSSSGVDAVIEHEGGMVHTDPEDIARILTRNWEKVFSEKEVDHGRMAEWLSLCGDLIPFSGDASEYVSAEADITKAIREANDSAPGPDGVPFRAWKIVQHVAAPVMRAVAVQLTRMSPAELLETNAFFNEAFMICLGKKAAFSQEDIGSVFLPSSTRPLSVVNTDNRIVAAAFRIKISKVVEPWISQSQIGFINGRSMLQNIIDIGTNIYIIVLCFNRSLMIFQTQVLKF